MASSHAPTKILWLQNDHQQRSFSRHNTEQWAVLRSLQNTIYHTYCNHTCNFLCNEITKSVQFYVVLFPLAWFLAYKHVSGGVLVSWVNQISQTSTNFMNLIFFPGHKNCDKWGSHIICRWWSFGSNRD